MNELNLQKTYPSGDITADTKLLRIKIDAVTNLAILLRQLSKPNEGNPIDPNTDFGREIALVITKLEEAKMWAGKVLERMGHELPTEFQDKEPIQ